MRDSYDFSNAKKNPYVARLKKQITIPIEEETIAYFEAIAKEKGMPYQVLMNLYLRKCAQEHKIL